MSFDRMVRSTPFVPPLLLGVTLGSLSLALLSELNGWSSLLAVVPLFALGAAGVLHKALRPQAGWDACTQAVKINMERTRELNTLQEALAHELKNPLAAIKGLTALIQLDPSRATERVDVLRSEVQRMERILDEHLTFARPLTPLALENVPVDTLVESVAELYEGMARQRDIRLITTTDVECAVPCDASKVKQVLMSLVHNAIDASPDGGIVEVHVERGDAWVRFDVLDRGPGVQKDEIARLFEAGITTKPDGTGLGLTLSRTLAEQHGGALTLENRADGGLRAVLELPR